MVVVVGLEGYVILRLMLVGFWEELTRNRESLSLLIEPS